MAGSPKRSSNTQKGGSCGPHVQRLSPTPILLSALRYLDMVESHFNDSILDQLPEKFKSFTEKKADNNMSESLLLRAPMFSVSQCRSALMQSQSPTWTSLSSAESPKIWVYFSWMNGA